MRPLKPAVIKVWTINYVFGAVLLLIGTVTFDVIQLLRGDHALLPAGLTTVVVLLASIGLCVFIPRWKYRYWRFNLDTEELYLERGIFNRVRTIVPLRRIQHLDVSQNLLEREFDLGKLIVHTAGSESSSVVLPGLDYAEAEQLRDSIKHYIVEDAV
ncbi:MAG: PH domain-containing protein [Rhodothermales bacterium]